MNETSLPEFPESLHQIYSQLKPEAVEQFYASYQFWQTRNELLIIHQQIAILQLRKQENSQQQQLLQPSPVALAALARLQAVGVQDVDLLDQLHERGELWLDNTLQHLDYCEQTGLFDGDYNSWCEHALEGAFDWIDSMAISDEPDAQSSLSEPDAQTPAATEALLLEMLTHEDIEEASQQLDTSPVEASASNEVPDDPLEPSSEATKPEATPASQLETSISPEQAHPQLEEATGEDLLNTEAEPQLHISAEEPINVSSSTTPEENHDPLSTNESAEPVETQPATSEPGSFESLPETVLTHSGTPSLSAFDPNEPALQAFGPTNAETLPEIAAAPGEETLEPPSSPFIDADTLPEIAAAVPPGSVTPGEEAPESPSSPFIDADTLPEIATAVSTAPALAAPVTIEETLEPEASTYADHSQAETPAIPNQNAASTIEESNIALQITQKTGATGMPAGKRITKPLASTSDTAELPNIAAESAASDVLPAPTTDVAAEDAREAETNPASASTPDLAMLSKIEAPEAEPAPITRTSGDTPEILEDQPEIVATTDNEGEADDELATLEAAANPDAEVEPNNLTSTEETNGQTPIATESLAEPALPNTSQTESPAPKPRATTPPNKQAVSRPSFWQRLRKKHPAKELDA